MFLLTHTSLGAGDFLSKRKDGLTFLAESCILVCMLLTRQELYTIERVQIGKTNWFLCHAISLGAKSRKNDKILCQDQKQVKLGWTHCWKFKRFGEK